MAQSSIHAILAAQIGLAASGSAAILQSLIIVGMAFLYGVLHAAGPGHGKVVVAAYLAGQRRPRLAAAVAMGASIAILQSLAAITVVGILLLVLGKAQLGRVDDMPFSNSSATP